jgi:DNA-binding beta-propeller fold protein YncE
MRFPSLFALGAAATAVIAVTVAATVATGAAAPAAGPGTIVLGSYSGHFTMIDEATEKVAAQIPFKNGIPWSARPSGDRTRFYVLSANLERFEVIDLRSRQSVDTFTLSDGNRHVRALAYEVDPQERFLVVVARTATKQIDRFEIGTPEFIRYDLKEHKVVQTKPWSADVEPRYYGLNLRFSPDGKFLYVFAHEILVLDAATLQQVDSWNLSLPNESGLNRFDPGSFDESGDASGFFTGLFTMRDPVENRELLIIGRVNLAAKSMDFFPLGPAPATGGLDFALAPDRKHAYILREEIGQAELWTVDLPGKRLTSRTSFKGRPRMAIRTSSSGQLIYIFEAGNTIDVYDADGFKFLRTITLDSDMKYGTFYVVAPSRPHPPSGH